MEDGAQSREGVLRVAETQLHSAGGRTVLLRMPTPAVPGDDAEQLGLATPEFQDLPMGPAVFHKANSVTKLVVSAEAVHGLVGTLGFDAVEVLFETAVGVVIDDVLYGITKSWSSQAGGVPYCYWLMLVAPVR
jgi:hypothetical protein